MAIAKNLMDAVATYNSRLAGPCADVIKHLSLNSDYDSMFKQSILFFNADQLEIFKQYGVIK